MNKNTNNKTLNEIANEWNQVSHKRQKIIEAGKDVSLIYVTSPCIIRNLGENKLSKILDVGCGTGYLTHMISSLCDLCCGIDASVESIKIAKKKYSSKKIKFLNSTISDLKVNYQFDACVSNMVIMTDPEWQVSLENIFNLLKVGGYLLIMLTHPCFWPTYWKYNNETWFEYNQEIYIEHDFKTSFSDSLGITTHIHRPLSMYVNTIQKTGFDIVKIEEPQPTKGTPEDYNYEYPRFLFIKCIKRAVRNKSQGDTI